MSKQRLTVTVSPDLVEAARFAVELGEADSVSAWVNAALEDRVRRDRQLRELAAAVADYEQEFGDIGAEEVAAQRRRDAADATVVRGSAASATS